MSILVTAGGTSEIIDGVRKLTNTSTGYTGSNIASHLNELGHEVNLLKSVNSSSSFSGNTFLFESFDDLEKELFHQLEKLQPKLLIHSAAVSDYKLDSICINDEEILNTDKIPSGQKLSLNFVPTKKLVNEVKSISPNTKLLAFKFTKTNSESERLAAVKKLITTSNADFVFWNDANLKKNEEHIFKIYNSNLEVLQQGTKSIEIPQKINEIIKEFL